MYIASDTTWAFVETVLLSSLSIIPCYFIYLAQSMPLCLDTGHTYYGIIVARARGGEGWRHRRSKIEDSFHQENQPDQIFQIEKSNISNWAA